MVSVLASDGAAAVCPVLSRLPEQIAFYKIRDFTDLDFNGGVGKVEQRPSLQC